jgi:hypothetical protein
VPRLELIGALLLSRLIHTVTRSLKEDMGLQEPVCYTDSKIALHWINGLDRDWKPFVQNQADVIRKLVPPSQWRHCRRKDNPADIPSKEMAMSMSELVDNSTWFKGVRI